MLTTSDCVWWYQYKECVGIMSGPSEIQSSKLMICLAYCLAKRKFDHPCIQSDTVIDWLWVAIVGNTCTWNNRKIVWWLDVIGSLAYVTQSMVDFYKGHRVTGSLASQSQAVFWQSQIVIPVADQRWHLLDWPPLGSLMNMFVYSGQCSVWLNCEQLDVRSEVTCNAPEIPWHALEDDG